MALTPFWPPLIRLGSTLRNQRRELALSIFSVLWRTIKLPEGVSEGRHDLVVVLDEKGSEKNPAKSHAEELMQFAGTVTAFKGIDGVAYQREIRSEWNWQTITSSTPTSSYIYWAVALHLLCQWDATVCQSSQKLSCPHFTNYPTLKSNKYLRCCRASTKFR